jgi:hypothetical protein
MFGNILLGFLSILLGISPYISRMESFNLRLGFSSTTKLTGPMEYFAMFLGFAGLTLCFHNLFVGKKFGAPFIVMGMLFLFIAFFFNEETIPRPVTGIFMGGDLFFAFIVSTIMAATGAVVEYLT